MALFTTLAALSQTAGSNAPDGTTDAPSSIDDQLRSLASFVAIERDGGHQWVTSVTGTNTITGSCPAISAYVAGQTFKFVAAGANTAAATLNVGSLGAKAITKNGSAALGAGDIPSGAVVEVVYDGTQFQLVNVAFAAGASSTSSYIVLPAWLGGWIIQWMVVTVSASNTQVFDLPTSFPTTFSAVLASQYGVTYAAGNNAGCGAIPNGLSQVKVENLYSASSSSIQLLCIGK